MGNEANKKFTWVIKNFSSFSPYTSESIYSDIFVAGHCKWRLLAIPRIGFGNNYLSLYLAVPNHESLPSGWRRHAKFSFTIVNPIPGEVSKLRETQNWFDQKNHTLGFESMMRSYELYTGEFIVNGELKIVAEVDVLEVVGKLDVPVVDMVVINGFQVLASQNPHLRTTYLNVTLGLTKILCNSPEKFSNSDLADAYSSLAYVTKAGFELDWLEKALKEAGETRIQDIEKELNDLTQNRADMDALLKFLK
ncbi:hypothetical protein N665_1279s0007 [Sinapis alba]|nr:hypothetical protein N665_1279s0007 [Sinapis alba]